MIASSGPSSPETCPDVPPLSPDSISLASLALREGLLTPSQLVDALAERGRDAAMGRNPQTLSVILLKKGFLQEDELRRLLDDWKALAQPAEERGAGGAEARTLGPYVIVRTLGRGTWGVVHEAREKGTERSVALKVLDLLPGMGPGDASSQKERFLREARLALTVPRHPGIVRVHETGEAEGRLYIAMELIRGVRMDTWQRMGASVWRRIALLRDVAYAVDHAHEAGVLHRDLKPGNILVDANNVPHVTDFGLAKSLRGRDVSLTGSGFVVGTPAYMSPEQARGDRALDRRADVYALGVMLYEILTGKPPFEGSSPVQLLLKTLEEPVRPPSTAVRAGAPLALDKAIERICLSALAKSPKDRTPTARALAEDLDGWLAGENVDVPRWKTRGFLGVILTILAAAGAAAALPLLLG